jgi:hypothetical protein
MSASVSSLLANDICFSSLLLKLFVIIFIQNPQNACLNLTFDSSNSSITELFQKVLSASDAGRIGRLVLPKACAEVSSHLYYL